ncbi:MAG: DUF1232 domain-containing protein [Anaerolineaceae bacterium]|nr:DUF1232 domain-containing protein [Anaerolineaceae bacterium]
MLKGFVNQILLTWRLLRDPRVPLWTKSIAFLGVIYILSPLDFIPDVFLIIGQLDDLGILLGGMRLFEALSPPYVVEEHRMALQQRGKPLETVNAPDYRIIDDSSDDSRA